MPEVAMGGNHGWLLQGLGRVIIFCVLFLRGNILYILNGMEELWDPGIYRVRGVGYSCGSS